MDLIHFILNAAAMLIWLSWRSHRFIPTNDFRGGTLLSTLKKTERGQFNQKTLITSLVLLLGIRAIFYWMIGSAVKWAPRMDLVVISIPFRSDYFDRMVLFSILSFAAWLGIFFCWLIFLQLVNHRAGDANPWQAIVRRHLGWISLLPAGVRLITPAVVTFLIWLVLSYYFTYLHILPEPRTWQHWMGQGVVLAITVHLLCSPLILAILFLHVLNSYVYLGNYAFLAYVNGTAQNILRVVRWAPLRYGKVDFAPFVMAALVLGIDLFFRRGWGEAHRLSLLWWFQQMTV
jgi:hypothetical protein